LFFWRLITAPELSIAGPSAFDSWTLDDVQDAHLMLDAIAEARRVPDPPRR
jgi:hypothetical protein